MKNFKKTVYLLMVVGFVLSCQQEEIVLNENSELKTLDSEVNKIESSQSILEIVASGIDLDSYFKSLQKIKSVENKNTDYEPDDNTVVQFYYSPEDFECTSLPTQNFEASNYSEAFAAPIDQYTNTIHFSPGDILPGISFDKINTIHTYDAFFIPSNSWGYESNVLMSSYNDGSLVLNFTNDDVYDVSMKLYNLQSDAMYVYIYDDNENYLDQTSVYYSHPADRPEGVFLAMHSEVNISKIVIGSEYGYEGIDEVSFGNCNNPDLDGDGILNEDDPYPNSNVSEMLSIGESYLDIKNTFIEDGTTMMDQIDALIAEINAQYNGDNWDTLHREFMRELSKITYYWTKKRLITRRERTQISSAAYRADIPYYYETT